MVMPDNTLAIYIENYIREWSSKGAGLTIFILYSKLKSYSFHHLWQRYKQP